MKPRAVVLLLLACACAPSSEPSPATPRVITLDTTAPPPSTDDASPASPPADAAPASSSAAEAPAVPDIAATSAPAPAPAATLDPATCQAQSGPTLAGCRWTVAFQGRCGGAVLVHEPAPTPRCVCNGCLSDGDCKARAHGKCQTFYSVCSPPEKACVYPGNLCAGDGAACSKMTYAVPGNRLREHKQCTHDGRGHAVCGPRQSAPP